MTRSCVRRLMKTRRLTNHALNDEVKDLRTEVDVLTARVMAMKSLLAKHVSKELLKGESDE